MELSPLVLSLQTAFYSTLLTFFLGLYAAKRRLKIKRFGALVDTVFTLPMVLPPTVIGFLLLLLFSKQSMLGSWLLQWGIEVVFSRLGMVIAATVVAFPIMYRTARGALEDLDPDLIAAARTLGLSENKIFYGIMLPNCWRSIMAGVVLAFARALGEFGATIMLAGNIPGKTQTMATAIYTAVQSGNRELATQWVVMMMGLSFGAMLILQLMTGGPKR